MTSQEAKWRLKNPVLLRWVMISLVFLATAINYLDRQTLSVIAPTLRDHFGMTNTDYGVIIFAFMLTYTVMNGFSGLFIDRVGTRVGYAVCVLLWSIAAILHAFATGVWSLGCFRSLLGMGEAGNWPAGVKVVAEWFPERERALATGIFNSGSSIGAILAPPVVIWITLRYGWRSSFILAGLSGLAWLLLWWSIYRSPAISAASTKPLPHERTFGFMELFRTPFLKWFVIAKIFIDPTWYFYTFWFPEYLRRVRRFSLADIGHYAWIPFFLAGLSNLLGGWISSRLVKAGLRAPAARNIPVVFFSLWMVAGIPAVLVQDSRWSIAFVSIAMMGYTGALANMLAMPADVFPSSAAASAYGIASMGAGFGGMLFSLLTGWLIDQKSYVPVFLGFSLTPLICSAILWKFTGERARAASLKQLGIYDAGSS